ncbi:hypothetical protein LCGC14_2976010, partial [marine sediment metagenome]
MPHGADAEWEFYWYCYVGFLWERLHTRYIFGVLLAIPFTLVFIGDVRKFMLGTFLFLVPVALNISPFYLDLNSPPQLYHKGAQPFSLQIWISSLPIAALLCIWTLEIALKRKKICFTPIDIPALLFIGWSFLSLFHSTRLDLSGAYFFRMVGFYLVYLYIVNNVTDAKILRFAVTVLLLGFIFQSLLAMAQYWLNLPFSIGDGKMNLYGGIVHRLDVGYVYRVRGTL